MGCIQSKSSESNSRPNSGDSQKATAAEKGLSVHYLSTVFLREAKDAGFNEKTPFMI